MPWMVLRCCATQRNMLLPSTSHERFANWSGSCFSSATYRKHAVCWVANRHVRRTKAYVPFLSDRLDLGRGGPFLDGDRAVARLPRVRFSMLEIPPVAPSDRGIPRPPREVTPAEDPLLARLLVHCARRALSSGPSQDDEGILEAGAHDVDLPGNRLSDLRDEAPFPLGETTDLPIQHQRWPRRDDAPRRPR